MQAELEAGIIAAADWPRRDDEEYERAAEATGVDRAERAAFRNILEVMQQILPNMLEDAPHKSVLLAAVVDTIRQF